MNVTQIARIVAVVLLAGCAACAPKANSDTLTDASPNPTPVSLPAAAPEATPETITITVGITKFRNSDGVVQVTLYDKEDEFLTEDSETARIVRVEIEEEKSTCEFAGITPGKYAIALMHDEDKDGKMKKSLIGLPKEGIGMSNDAKPKFGPPKWKDAVFTVGKEDVSVEITMLYL